MDIHLYDPTIFIGSGCRIVLKMNYPQINLEFFKGRKYKWVKDPPKEIGIYPAKENGIFSLIEIRKTHLINVFEVFAMGWGCHIASGDLNSPFENIEWMVIDESK